MAPIEYLFKRYNRNEVNEFTSSVNFPTTVDFACARKVYQVLAFSALCGFAGSLVQRYTHHLTPDVTFVNLLLMIWWAFYLNSQRKILVSIIFATFFLGLTLGGQHVTTYLHLDETTPSYALAGVALLFFSHLTALYTHSPALVFNHNILALPLYMSCILFAQLHFSPPSFKPGDSPPSGDAVLAFIRPHLSPLSPLFIAVIAFLWLLIFFFFKQPNLRLGVLVPFHLHLMSLLVYLSGHSLYYLTFLYTVWLLFAYNLRYHAFDTMFPPAVSTSTEVPQGTLILATNVPGDACIILSGRYPEAHSCVLSFFTHFLGRSTYIFYQPVSMIVALVWGISHVEFEAVRAAILRYWLSAKIYGLRVWGACYAFYGSLIEGGRFTVRWFQDFLLKTATFSMFLVLFFAIVFAFKK